MTDMDLLNGTSNTTDTSFLRKVQAGNEDAWRQFYVRYSEMIRQIGIRRHLSPADCQDLHSEVMTIFWRKMDSFIYDRCRGSFRRYLARLTDSAVDRIFRRTRSCGKAAPEAPPEYPPDVDAVYMDEWRDFLLQKAVDELRDNVDTETYQVFFMSVIQNRPVQDIAAVTRKTPNNIYVIRFRCLKKLRQLILSYRHREDAPLSDGSSQRNM